MKNLELYKELHQTSDTFGSSGKKQLDRVCLFIDYLKPKTVLDYGCGKGNLIAQLSLKYPDIKFYGYDPAIEGKDILPIEHADLVINTDVLEHIPEAEIEDVVNKISKISNNVYFHLHHGLAVAILPNGENAHCTVKPVYWYYNLFDKYFKTQTILECPAHFNSVILTFPIPAKLYKEYYKLIREEKKGKTKKANIESATKPLTKEEDAKNDIKHNPIFSIYNEYKKNKKRKIISIFGIKIKFKTIYMK